MKNPGIDVAAAASAAITAASTTAPRDAGGPEFELLLGTSLDGVLWVGPGGGILRANAAACQLLGLAPARLLGAHARDLVAPCDVRARSLIERCRWEGRSDGVLTALRGDGAPVEVRVRMSRYVGAGGRPHALVLLRAADEPVHRGAKAGSEVHRIAPALAHDLRAPLGTLAGFAKALERALGKNASQRSRHYVERILAAVAQLEQHVEALLSCARLAHATLAPSRVDLSAASRRILRDLQLRDLDRVVSVQVQDGICADGDPHLLGVVLENLLGNAWKFTARQREASISFTAEAAPDGRVIYRVRDNGAGFDMAYGQKLFCDFQRLHSQSEFPGTGIGLANVQRIVARHGGRVWAESAPGQGATFSFTVGAAADGAAGSHGSSASSPKPLRDEMPA